MPHEACTASSPVPGLSGTGSSASAGAAASSRATVRERITRTSSRHGDRNLLRHVVMIAGRIELQLVHLCLARVVGGTRRQHIVADIDPAGVEAEHAERVAAVVVP